YQFSVYHDGPSKTIKNLTQRSKCDAALVTCQYATSRPHPWTNCCQRYSTIFPFTAHVRACAQRFCITSKKSLLRN
ncbi:hypothetical protein L9F63_024095, partial [Diploptera punctata]